MTGLLGGAFDPPHNGHVALADAAEREFDLDELVVLVSSLPGHKAVALDGETRLRLAQAAFTLEPDLRLRPETGGACGRGNWGTSAHRNASFRPS